MTEHTIESEIGGKAAPESAPTRRQKSGKKPKAAKKPTQAKKLVVKPKADRANKKAKVIAMMKRTKGATLAEIMEAMRWQAHTVRGFVNLPWRQG